MIGNPTKSISREEYLLQKAQPIYPTEWIKLEPKVATYKRVDKPKKPWYERDPEDHWKWLILPLQYARKRPLEAVTMLLLIAGFVLLIWINAKMAVALAFG